jgi:hypothetical protein
MPKVHKFWRFPNIQAQTFWIPNTHWAHKFWRFPNTQTHNFWRTPKTKYSQFRRNSKIQAHKLQFLNFKSFLQCFFFFFHLIMPKSKSCNKQNYI